MPEHACGDLHWVAAAVSSTRIVRAGWSRECPDRILLDGKISPHDDRAMRTGLCCRAIGCPLMVQRSSRARSRSGIQQGKSS
jgi:hypothetical protein